ncbi:MAG: carboxylesterase/lipase family protein [Chitinophagales bacterium]
MRSLLVKLIPILLISISFSSFDKSGDSLQIVKTDAGQVSGSLNTTGDVYAFKGIPFAAPPVGDLRWKAPQPVKPWDAVKKCLAFGPSPMQPTPAPFSMWSEEFLIPKEPISEDCLYLNVWTGAKSAGEKRAVLVWIYGGGFASGGSAVPIYDGEAMAKKGIVFVSINYRVGPFGFFAHPDLTKESGKNASGNYGIMDQIAALKWIQKNITQFGGDPGNVTIAGQSAGSFSVNCLVATPLAKGLFQKAIGESGAIFSNAMPNLAKGEEGGLNIAKTLNASSIADLRKISAEDIMKKGMGLRGLIVDGYVLPESVAQIFAEGKENKVSLMTGWNQDEGLMFGATKKAEDFKKDLNDRYGEHATTALKYFPADNDSIAALSQSNLSRDMVFGSQNYAWAKITADHGSKVYLYRFARKVPGTGIYAKYGAFHTGEVPYAYDNLKFVNRPWQESDHQLAETMSSYWANFIKTGIPNGKNLPNWPAYTKNGKEVMMLNERCAAEKLPEAEELDFLLAATT